MSTGTPMGTQYAGDSAVARPRGLRGWVRARSHRAAARAVEGLYEAVRANPDAATGPGAASVTASVLAWLVHLVTLAMVVLAVVLLALTPTHPVAVVPAVLLLGAAWLTRPRPGNAPAEVRVGGVRADAGPGPSDRPCRGRSGPAAGRLRPPAERDVPRGRLAARAAARHRHAACGRRCPASSGSPSSRTSSATLPRATPVTGCVVSSALAALREWMLLCHYEVSPVTGAERHTVATPAAGLVQLSEMVARWVLAVVGLVPAAAYAVLLAVTQRQSQRAEYGADLAGAAVAGRQAMVAALSTVMEGDALLLAMRRTAMGSTDRDVLAAVRAEGQRLSAADWPSRRNRRRNGPFDSHPPDDLRRGLVQTLPELPPDGRAGRHPRGAHRRRAGAGPRVGHPARVRQLPGALTRDGGPLRRRRGGRAAGPARRTALPAGATPNLAKYSSVRSASVCQLTRR